MTQPTPRRPVQLAFRARLKPGERQHTLEYLTLAYPADQAHRLAIKLDRGSIQQRRADDILRAARRDPLPLNDPRVARELERARAGKKLHAIQIVQTSRGTDIANGEHTLAVAYHAGPDGPATRVACVIAADT